MCQNKPRRKAYQYAPRDEQRRRLYDIVPERNKRGLCAVRYCRNQKLTKGRICARCQWRRKKLNDPIGYAFAIVQSNAKRRGKVFTITKEYFRELCEQTGYLEGKGRRADALSLDRINPTLGYIEGNVRVLGYGLNSSRACDDYDHDPTNDLPF